MKREIIDFHTHPFSTKEQNLLMYKDTYDIDRDMFADYCKSIGTVKVCGSVASTDKPANLWEKVRRNNDTAYELKRYYGDFYCPGIHIHPDFVRESCSEIEYAAKNGIKMIGELVPYLDGWDYDNPAISEIMRVARDCGMIVSVHSDYTEKMNRFIENCGDITVVGAHPSEWNNLFSQVKLLKQYPNYMIDISATGITRFGMIKKLVDEVGSKRLIFGSDFPICDPAVFIAGVENAPFITENDKENIFSRNAKRILGGAV